MAYLVAQHIKFCVVVEMQIVRDDDGDGTKYRK